MTGIEWGPSSAVIVTGGASGIGRASARALAEVGRPVAIWDLVPARCAQVADEIAKEFGVATCAAGFDIREHERFETEIEAARSALGELGGLVHSAGVAHPIPIDELEPEDWDSVLAINLRAEALLVRALLPDLRRSEGAAIVGIASINAILGNGLNPRLRGLQSRTTRSHTIAGRSSWPRRHPGQRDLPRLYPDAYAGRRFAERARARRKLRVSVDVRPNGRGRGDRKGRPLPHVRSSKLRDGRVHRRRRRRRT